MTVPAPSFFSPPAWPSDEPRRQSVVDRTRWREAAADPLLVRIVARTAALFGTSRAALTIIDRDRQALVVRAGFDVAEASRATSFCGHAVLAPDMILAVPDAAADRRFAGNPFVTGPFGLRFYAGAPLVVRGAAIGALCVLGSRPRAPLAAFQADQLRDLARSVAEVLTTRYH